MIDQNKLTAPFKEKKGHLWPCPSCDNGHLIVVESSFASGESSTSISLRDEEAWELDWIELIFSCLLECNNTNCKETVACSGIGSVDVRETRDYRGRWTRSVVEEFQPKFFVPALRIFKFPDITPEEVSSEIEASFSLFFTNPSSAANRTRAAIESLLTFLKVKRFTLNKYGKRVPLSLDTRISLLPAKHADIRNRLLAIKWLGNAGSHQGKTLSALDMIDAYTILEEVLDELFVRSKQTGHKLAKAIVDRKGPVKR